MDRERVHAYLRVGRAPFSRAKGLLNYLATRRTVVAELPRGLGRGACRVTGSSMGEFGHGSPLHLSRQPESADGGRGDRRARGGRLWSGWVLLPGGLRIDDRRERRGID